MSVCQKSSTKISQIYMCGQCDCQPQKDTIVTHYQRNKKRKNYKKGKNKVVQSETLSDLTSELFQYRVIQN